MSAEFTSEVRDIVTARSGGRCEVCGDPAWDVHHRHPRKSGGTKRQWVGLASNALAVCRLCHNLIESRRHLAMLLGWLVPADTDPSLWPVVYRGDKVVLDADGGIERVPDDPERTPCHTSPLEPEHYCSTCGAYNPDSGDACG